MKKVLMTIGIIAITGVIIYWFMGYYQVNSARNEDVITVYASIGDINSAIKEEGEIKALNTVRYYSNGVDKLETINYQVGDSVGLDDLLFSYQNDLDLQKAIKLKEIESTQAELDALIKGPSENELNEVISQINQIEAKIDRALVDLNNTKELYELDAITEKEYEMKKNEVIDLENSLDLLRNKLATMNEGISDEMLKKYTANLEALQIACDMIDRQLDDTLIRSDLKGIVTEVNGTVNAIPAAGTLIMEIQDTENMIVSVKFLVEDAVLLNVGTKVIVRNEDIGFEIAGLTITKIHPKTIDELSELGLNQKKVEVEIELSEDYREFIIGMDVEVEAILEESIGVLLIPKSFVFDINGKSFVSVMRNGDIEDVEVLVGLENDEYVSILEGIDETDQVVNYN